MTRFFMIGTIVFIYSCLPYEEDDSYYYSDSSTNLYVYDVETSKTTQLTEFLHPEDINNFRISGDGKKVIIETHQTTHLMSTENWEITHTLNNFNYGLNINYSGNKIVYSKYIDNNDQLFVYDFETEIHTQVTGDTVSKRGPKFVNDTTIYYHKQFLDGLQTIYSVNTISMNTKQILTLDLIDEDKYLVNYWSINENTLVYLVTHWRGIQKLYRYSMNSVSSEWITNTRGLANLSFFAENDSLCFAMTSGSEQDVFTISISGGEKTKWTDDARDDNDPSISTSGEYIVYISSEERNQTLFLLKKSTMEKTMIEEDNNVAGWFEKPRFIPNTNRIIYLKAIPIEE